MRRKTFTFISAVFISLISIGTGLGSWVYNSSSDKSTEIGDDNIHVDDFTFQTLTIKESEKSSSGTLSKIGNTIHSLRCDGKDLGYTNATIDVCEYFTITAEDESNLSKARYKIVSGSGTLNGDELTFGDTEGDVVIRCYEDGVEDNYLDLTFKNTIIEDKGSHQFKTTYNTIAWNSWSTTATYSSNDQHTFSRTGLLPYSEICSVCSTKGSSGNLTIDSSNYSIYSAYNTDSNTYIKTESCVKDSGTYLEQTWSRSYGSKTYSGYSTYSATQHKHNYTQPYYDTAGYSSGYKYYCTSCSHLMEDTRTYYSAYNGSNSSYDYESHDFDSTTGGDAIICSGTITRESSPYTYYTYSCNSCGKTYYSYKSSCTASVKTTSYSCSSCGASYSSSGTCTKKIYSTSYSCSSCGASYSSSGTCKKQISTTKKVYCTGVGQLCDWDDSIRCSVCGKACSRIGASCSYYTTTTTTSTCGGTITGTTTSSVCGGTITGTTTTSTCGGSLSSVRHTGYSYSYYCNTCNRSATSSEYGDTCGSVTGYTTEYYVCSKCGYKKEK